MVQIMMQAKDAEGSNATFVQQYKDTIRKKLGGKNNLEIDENIYKIMDANMTFGKQAGAITLKLREFIKWLAFDARNDPDVSYMASYAPSTIHAAIAHRNEKQNVLDQMLNKYIAGYASKESFFQSIMPLIMNKIRSDDAADVLRLLKQSADSGWQIKTSEDLENYNLINYTLELKKVIEDNGDDVSIIKQALSDNCNLFMVTNRKRIFLRLPSIIYSINPASLIALSLIAHNSHTFVIVVDV